MQDPGIEPEPSTFSRPALASGHHTRLQERGVPASNRIVRIHRHSTETFMTRAPFPGLHECVGPMSRVFLGASRERESPAAGRQTQ